MTKNTNRIGRILGLILLAFIFFYVSRFITDEKDAFSLSDETAQIHFIDVGQGDSILIRAGDASMLIDAGENNQGDTVVQYLKEQGITQLDYLIGTHPHSDHIGGLDTVINSFPVKKVIMPDVIHTTKTFEDVLDAIDENGLTITKSIPGTTYPLGRGSFTIIAPNSDKYSSLNDYSVGIKFTFGDIHFVSVGDAEALSEKEMLNLGYDLSADLFKLSHHGSSTSNTDAFLDAIDPEYVVITVGRKNDYGHPHKEIYSALKKRKAAIYRTDEQQDIVFITDGTNISADIDPYQK